MVRSYTPDQGTSSDEDHDDRIVSSPAHPTPAPDGNTNYFPSATSPDAFLSPSLSYGTAAHKFRASVNKIMEMKRNSESLPGYPVGSEPGIDPRRDSAIAQYSQISELCEIEVVDYSSGRGEVDFKQFDNAGLIKFLDGKDFVKPPWATVRWINVGGVSWDVLSALALKYDLHPLSLEDVIHSRGTTRSKADYYNRHLFIHLLCHSLEEDGASPLDPTYTRNRSSSPTRISGEDQIPTELPSYGLLSRIGSHKRKNSKQRSQSDQEAPPEIATPAPPRRSVLRWRDRTLLRTPEGRRRVAELATLEVLKRGERVNVLIRNTFFFLLRDGTLISIHQTDRGFGNPILARLQEEDTLLRRSADPSLLLEALLDLVVDQALAVADKYGELIAKFEKEVLLRTSMNTVRNLHILSGDLVLHKRTLTPVKSLVYGLRRYDIDRCATLVAEASIAAGLPLNESGLVSTEKPKVVGYMSQKAKVYLADVQDHVEYILTSLDMYSDLAENLVNYTFNMASRETNEVMRRMTLAMIIFLPLTLLTGYFGMNFSPMPAVNEHSDILFWQIAVPVMAIIVPLFLWGDIQRMMHYLRKQALIRRLEREQLKKTT